MNLLEFIADVEAQLLSFHVSPNDEQSLPGSQAQTQAQASSSSSRRNYFMRAMRERVSNDMHRPMRTNTPSADPSYEPNPYPSRASSPGLSPTSAITPDHARWPFKRGHSVPNNFIFDDSWVTKQHTRRNSAFSSTGVFGNGAATNLPLPTRLQTPVQSPVQNRLGVETSSLSQPIPPRSREHAMRELKPPLERTTSARHREMVARRAQLVARAQERKMIIRNRRNATLTWVREQRTIERDRRMDGIKQGGGPGCGIKFPAAAGAWGVPPLGVAMEENGHGYLQVQEESGYTSSLDGNVSDSDQMELEEEDSEPLQVNVSDDEEMDEGPSPDRLESFQAGLSYRGQIGMMVPPDTESLDGNVSDDDDQMEE